MTDQCANIEKYIENIMNDPKIKIYIDKFRKKDDNLISFLLSYIYIYNTCAFLKNVELPKIILSIVNEIFINDIMYNKINVIETRSTEIEENMRINNIKVNKLDKYYNEKMSFMYEKTMMNNDILAAVRNGQDKKIQKINDKVDKIEDFNTNMIYDKLKNIDTTIDDFKKTIFNFNTTGLELRVSELEESKKTKQKPDKSNQKIINRLSLIESKIKSLEDNIEKNEIKELKVKLENQQNMYDTQFKTFSDNINSIIQKQQKNYNIQLKEIQNKLDKRIKNDKITNDKLLDFKNILDNMNRNFVKQQSNTNKINEDKIVKIVQYNIQNLFNTQQPQGIDLQQYEHNFRVVNMG